MLTCHCCHCEVPADTPRGACPDCESLDAALCDSCATYCWDRRSNYSGACGACARVQAEEARAERLQFLMESESDGRELLAAMDADLIA